MWVELVNSTDRMDGRVFRKRNWGGMASTMDSNSMMKSSSSKSLVILSLLSSSFRSFVVIVFGVGKIAGVGACWGEFWRFCLYLKLWLKVCRAWGEWSVVIFERCLGLDWFNLASGVEWGGIWMWPGVNSNRSWRLQWVMISFSKGVSKLQRAHSKFILTVVYPKGLEMYGDLNRSKKKNYF